MISEEHEAETRTMSDLRDRAAAYPTWTSDLPTSVGWYWMDHPNNLPYVTVVMVLAGSDVEFAVSGFGWSLDDYRRCRWAGPLRAPADDDGRMSKEKHCPTCICGRRAPVQADGMYWLSKDDPRRTGHGPGTIAWTEHLLAWNDYVRRYPGQSAERIAERGGFSYEELVDHLGREPTTWEPAR